MGCAHERNHRLIRCVVPAGIDQHRQHDRSEQHHFPITMRDPFILHHLHWSRAVAPSHQHAPPPSAFHTQQAGRDTAQQHFVGVLGCCLRLLVLPWDLQSDSGPDELGMLDLRCRHIICNRVLLHDS
jgi:hypothetical protein